MGYDAIKAPIEAGVRHLKEVKLYEGSIVVFPMNEMALITSVKARGREGAGAEGKGDFNEELTEIQTLSILYQMESALWKALSSVVYNQLARDEKITAAAAIIEQFQNAFSNFFPAYLDALGEAYGPMETWSKQRFEIKAGAMFSAANKKSMTAALEKIKGGHDDLLALFAEEAGDDSTSSEKAAKPPDAPLVPAEDKSEPDDHSAAEILTEIMAELSAV